MKLSCAARLKTGGPAVFKVDTQGKKMEVQKLVLIEQVIIKS